MTTTQMIKALEDNMNKHFAEQSVFNARLLETLESLNGRVTTIENGGKGNKKSANNKKSVSTSSNTKKSTTSEPKQTREERLTEKFGDKELRTKWAKAKSEGFITLHEVMGHEDYYGLKKNKRAELASKFADLRVASPKKSAKTIAKEVLK